MAYYPVRFAECSGPPAPWPLPPLPLLVAAISCFKQKSRLMRQHASRRGNISVSPPLWEVFMTGLQYVFFLACWYEEGGSEHTHTLTHTLPIAAKLCSDGAIYEGTARTQFEVNASKMPFRFLPKYQIHHDSSRNQAQRWRVEVKGREGGAAAIFKYAFSLLSCD